jgi:hypothetical protein
MVKTMICLDDQWRKRKERLRPGNDGRDYTWEDLTMRGIEYIEKLQDYTDPVTVEKKSK